jgi:Sec-independent protein translocase protein TatA
VFGVSLQELLIVGLLILVVFGPLKAVSMAHDLGRFANETRRTVEEFKEKLLSEEIEDLHRTAIGVKDDTGQP